MNEDETAPDPVELALALLSNSQALVEDAELLLEHERRPRAAALALMALEEVSKIQLCLEAIAVGTSVPAARSKAWTNHQGKFTGARALELAFLDEAPDLDRVRVQESVAEDQRAKMACLYVDHDGGQIARPSEFVIDATQIVDRARNAVALLRGFVSHLSPEVMDEIRTHRDALERYFASMVDEDDMGATVGRFRAALKAASKSTSDGRRGCSPM